MKITSFGSLLIIALFLSQMLATSAYGISGSYLSIYRDTEKSFSELEGKVSFVDCFATWCPTCKVLHPELQKVYAHFGDQINILSLSIDNNDTPDMLRDYANTYSFDWGRAGIDSNKDFQNAYDFPSIPALFLFDADGANVRQWSGVVSSDELISVVNLLLGITTSSSSTISSGSSSTTTSILEDFIKNPFVQLGIFLTIFIIIIIRRK